MTLFLIVRGPLGAGKTTVARALARALSGTVISIDEVLELQEWDGGSEELFLRANEVAAERALGSLRRGVAVVLEGNFYWASVIDDLVRRLPYPHAIFSLRVPLRACIERDRLRPLSYGEEATRAVFRKAARVRRGVPLDGTRPVAEVVSEVRATLSRLGVSDRLTRLSGRSSRAGPPSGRAFRRKSPPAAERRRRRVRRRASGERRGERT